MSNIYCSENEFCEFEFSCVLGKMTTCLLTLLMNLGQLADARNTRF